MIKIQRVIMYHFLRYDFITFIKCGENKKIKNPYYLKFKNKLLNYVG